MYQANQLSIVLRFYVNPHRKRAISNICGLDLTGPAAMSGDRSTVWPVSLQSKTRSVA